MLLRSAKENILIAKPVWRLVRAAKLFSGEFFWLQHFPSISGCGDSRVCSVSWLQLTLFDFRQAMIPRYPPSMTGGSGSACFWTHMHRSFSLVCFMPVIEMHFCRCISIHICIYIHLCLYVYTLFMLYVHVCTAF